MFNLILFDANKEVCDAFTVYFSDLPNVQVQHKLLQDLGEYAFDCLVSSANSFGLMDGGIDKYITELYGEQLMNRVQYHIIENYAGEQPVGTSFLINLDETKEHYLAHTPTMRIPMNIYGTDNVYRAMKAMLVEVIRFNEDWQHPINTVACSGLGTLCGSVPPLVAAKQMRLAYEHVINIPDKINWKFAMKRHKEIMDCIEVEKEQNMNKYENVFSELTNEEIKELNKLVSMDNSQ